MQSCLTLTILLKYSPVNTVINYLKEVRFELDKVIWPNRNEVTKLTLTIVVITLIVAVYLGALDYVFTKALEAILTI